MSATKPETRGFQAEVSKLLYLMTHSVYSQKEIFLRELISNASDACDRLRYLAIAEPALLTDDPQLRITIAIDRQARALTLSDNGVGMSREELIDNLGTIARSGTQAFVSQMSGDAKADLGLIGQFGVGFYSAFMVAREVVVTSRKAGSAEAHVWTSDGLGEFVIEPGERAQRGTSILLKLRDGEDEYLDEANLSRIVKTYSDHIAVPIMLKDGEAEAKQANAGAALWTRPRGEIKDDQLKEFFRHVNHGAGEPWLTVHARAEGRMEYAMLLFVPDQRPFDLFDPARKHRVKLYVKRVYITDDAVGLVPSYLRFLRGVVDSQDLPLNISREMLQNNPVIARISQAVTKRVLSELEKKAADAPDEYLKFWENFGSVLKEGIYEDRERRENLLKLIRVKTTKSDGQWISLDTYVGRMKPEQPSIYVITGEDAEAVGRSPQLEGFAARGLEVVLLSDAVDGFWINTAGKFRDKDFASVTRGGADLEKFALENETAKPKDEDKAEGSALATLIAAIKQGLGERVKDVRASNRLTGSAVCLVASEGDIDMHLARLLKAHKQIDKIAPRVLELNPNHALIKALAAKAKSAGASVEITESAELLYDLARIVEGEHVADPAAFARRLTEAMTRAYGA